MSKEQVTIENAEDCGIEEEPCECCEGFDNNRFYEKSNSIWCEICAEQIACKGCGCWYFLESTYTDYCLGCVNKQVSNTGEEEGNCCICNKETTIIKAECNHTTCFRCWIKQFGNIPDKGCAVKCCPKCVAKMKHEQWNNKHPYTDRDFSISGYCEKCEAKCETIDDKLCHYCYHHSLENTEECWCCNK